MNLQADLDREAEPEQHGRRLVIVERNAFFRECLLRSLVREWPKAVAVATLAEASNSVAPDEATTILLSRLSLSDGDVEAELAQLKAMSPEAQCLVLGAANEPDEVLSVLGQGAKGYVAISSTFEDFVASMRRVSAGSVCIPPSLANTRHGGSRGDLRPDAGITSRERAVISAIRAGRSNKMIAYDLNVSENTVKVHVRNIMRKLRARNRTEVVIMALNLAKRATDGAAEHTRGSIAMDGDTL